MPDDRRQPPKYGLGLIYNDSHAGRIPTDDSVFILPLREADASLASLPHGRGNYLAINIAQITAKVYVHQAEATTVKAWEHFFTQSATSLVFALNRLRTRAKTEDGKDWTDSDPDIRLVALGCGGVKDHGSRLVMEGKRQGVATNRLSGIVASPLRITLASCNAAIEEVGIVTVHVQACANAPAQAAPAAGEPAKATHSADFTFVNWFGTEYTFALGVQSAAVKALWDEWENTGLGLHQDTIREVVDAERDSFRMDKTFRDHPALGTMIQKIGDGKYKLNPQSIAKNK